MFFNTAEYFRRIAYQYDFEALEALGFADLNYIDSTYDILVGDLFDFIEELEMIRKQHDPTYIPEKGENHIGLLRF